MEKIEFGIPNRVFFELFSGAHPSDKIYSVQVADWDEFTAQVVRDKNQEVWENKTHLEYKETPAVVSLQEQELKTKADHLLVEPTEELVAFLEKRGIEIPEELWVQPLAFKWEEAGEDDIVMPDGDVIEDLEKELDEEYNKQKSNKAKALLAGVIALITLLR